MSGLESARARSNRKKLPEPIIVESNTIGCPIHFPLTSENVSKSGLLLSWESEHYVPFQENTIIEMIIDKESQYLEKPLVCLGKIVRKESNSSNQARFGTRIVQIDPKDQYAWEGMVQDLDERSEA